MPQIKTKPPFFPTLTGYDFTKEPPLSPRKAIRKKCLECMCGSSEEVRKCQITDCTLWPYRLGRGVTQDPEGREVTKRKGPSGGPPQKGASNE